MPTGPAPFQQECLIQGDHRIEAGKSIELQYPQNGCYSRLKPIVDNIVAVLGYCSICFTMSFITRDNGQTG